MKVVTVKQMRAIERSAVARGLPYEQMMQHAGKSLAAWIRDHVKAAHKTITGLVGAGNNGGDTLIALQDLANLGWNTTAYIVKPRPEPDSPLKNYQAGGGKVIRLEDDPSHSKLLDLLGESSALMDGVLGTGVKLPLSSPVDKVLETTRDFCREQPSIFVVAVDCPSGVDCDSGEVAPEAIPANVTICMAAVKQGLLKMPAFGLVGEITVVDIGLQAGLPEIDSSNRYIITGEEIRKYLPERRLDAHKGTFGTALIIAGCINYTGAAYLAARAAYRIGTGLVTLGVVHQLHAALAGHLPEVTWLILPDEEGVIGGNGADVVHANLERVSALLIGPGLGHEDQTLIFFRKLFTQYTSRAEGQIGFAVSGQKIESDREPKQLPPSVIDADGLRLLSHLPDWQHAIPSASVLTPHPGEMACLTGLSTTEIQADRPGTAERFAALWNHVVVLKGALTVVAEPNGRTGIIPVATPALARAGTGDVLAGIICGLRAQGLTAYEAAAAGTWLHAKAGLRAADRLGNTASVLAGDVLEAVPSVLTELL